MALDKDLDRQWVVNHVAAVLLVILVRLDAAVCTPGARQQGVSPRLLRRVDSSDERSESLS